MTRETTTHLSLGIAGLLHIAMSRQELIGLLENANESFAFGLDLPLFAKKTVDGPFLRTNLYLTLHDLRSAMIAQEHTVEVSDEPMGSEDDPPIAQVIGGDSDGLSVELG